MNDNRASEIVNKITKAVFNRDNKLNLDEVLARYAFDVKLPKQVVDSTTNEITWADSINSKSFITLDNANNKDEKDGWMQEKQDIESLDDLLKIWDSINLTSTERVQDSVDVIKSDTIYNCQSVYRSSNCSKCNNIVYCDSCGNGEYLLASSRSGSCNFCIRTDDSVNCTNCYSVQWSNKISNSYFIQDCFNLDECIFCSHIANKKYCIANMQFEKEEYYSIKEVIIEWIFNS